MSRLRWFLPFILCAMSFGQLGQVTFENRANVPVYRVWSATLVFNEGEVFNLDALGLDITDSDDVMLPVWWMPFGPKHTDSSHWFARCDVLATLQPGKTTAKVVLRTDEERQQSKFGFSPTFVAGWNRAKVLLEWDQGLGDEGWTYSDALDQGWSWKPDEYHGGMLTRRTRVQTGACAWRCWATTGSQESGFDLHLGPFNDAPNNPPGLITGRWRVHFIGCNAMPIGGKGFSLKPLLLDEELNTSIWELPIGNLCDTQGWLCAFRVSFLGLQDAANEALTIPFGLMTRDTWLAVELPETQLPDVGDAAWRATLGPPGEAATWAARANQLKANAFPPFVTNRNNDPRYPYDPYGNNLQPASSGDQAPFGMFPYHVRALLENGDQDSLFCGEMHALRGLGCRPGWIWGLKFVDGVPGDGVSWYSWYDQIHRSSSDRKGRVPPLYRCATPEPSFNGWQGEEGEHFGERPWFWQAFVAHRPWIVDLFRDRAEISRGYAHTVPYAQGGYFGGTIDAQRTEGRWASKELQAWLLTNDDQILAHVILRGEKILSEYRTRVHNGTPAPYGALDARMRNDACIEYQVTPKRDCCPIFLAWQAALIVQPYELLARKTAWKNGHDVAAEIGGIILDHCFAERDGRLVWGKVVSAFSKGPYAYAWKPVNRPEEEDPTYSTGVWASLPLRDVLWRKQVFLRLNDAQRDRLKRYEPTVNTVAVQKGKWAAAPYVYNRRVDEPIR